ncbi:hypothetical protein LTR37_003483 [Vermiconidia calcicola]|uniref:Uncharacterized protein n=1 Tax=Vermiconidia calcicola TaxID=1690605 RepID=A0ACC3NPY6_9PEZI|nr:hypothetical protein LTR37_003483 [Vermiconidia calcicola]
MTDSGRKGMGDKASEKMTPDSSKSTLDKAKEGVTDMTDKAGRDAVPDDQKSTGQQISDKTSREKNSSGNSGESMMDKAKDTLGMNK